MSKFREFRLKREVQERVLINGGDELGALHEVHDKLFKEWDWFYDNDRHVQAFDVQRDLVIVKNWLIERDGFKNE